MAKYIIATALLLVLVVDIGSSHELVKRSDDPNALDVVVQQLSAKVTELEARLAAQEAHSATQRQRKVAFLAQFAANPFNTTDKTLKFDKVIFNDGNGYDPVTGMFTATHAGVYLFSFQIFTHSVERPQIDIMRNSQPVSRMAVDAKGDPESDVSTIVLQLTAGDRVWVENFYLNSRLDLWGLIHTYFSGALIYPE